MRALGCTTLAGVAVLMVMPVRAATFTVTVTGDSADGVCDGHCSLREAIGAANALPGADVVVPAGTYRLAIAGALEDANATGDLDVSGDLAISGAGAGATIVDAEQLDRVLHVVNAELEIDGVTLRNGVAAGAPGGGIAVYGGALHLRGVAVSGNRSASGGGVYAGASDLTVIDSTLADNQSPLGGGLYFQGFTRHLEVRNSTISGNSADAGGGLFVDLECGFSTPCTVMSTTIANNVGNAGAGGLRCIAPLGSLTLSHTLLADNGGGSCAPSSVVSLGHNLDDDGNCPFTAAGDRSAQPSALLPLRSNGGSTDTHGLGAGSAAIDAGGSCPSADQRGQPRDGACDIGSFEAAPGPCGDGIAHLGEACDDGNGIEDDCCTSACAAAADGAPCADDGDLCSTDVCDGARAECVHAAVPASGCRAAERSRLTMRADDGVRWKWLRGAATSLAELGDPLSASRYTLCIYGETGVAPVGRVDVAPDAVRWRARRSGFRYRDGGVGRSLLLRSGAAARSRIRLRADDAGVPALPIAPQSLTVQLHNDPPGACWETRFDAAEISRNDAHTLKAKQRH